MLMKQKLKDLEEQAFRDEFEAVAKKYKDILTELDKKFRQEVRLMGVRKNVVPKKYILPKEYITRLLENFPFRQAWERKLLWRYIKEDNETKGRWIKIQTFPNIGGVLVEEGPELKVIVERIPRRKRLRKNS